MFSFQMENNQRHVSRMARVCRAHARHVPYPADMENNSISRNFLRRRVHLQDFPKFEIDTNRFSLFRPAIRESLCDTAICVSLMSLYNLFNPFSTYIPFEN